MSKIQNMTPEQQRLFAQLLEQEGISSPKLQIIPKRKNPEVTASFAQQRLWFLQEFESEKALYNCLLLITLRGPLQAGLLQRALEQIVARHESLRTTFTMKEGHPVLRIEAAAPLDLRVVDLAQARSKEEEKRRIIHEQAQQPFDLERSPLLRAILLRISKGEHVLVTTTHHIATDSWSSGIFLRELSALYDCFSQSRELSLPELPIHYADYAAWQRAQFDSGAWQEQLDYWKEKLRDLPELLELSIAGPRPAIQGHSGSRHYFVLPDELLPALQRLGQQSRATLFMTLLTSFQILLQRYSGHSDVVIGAPIAGRHWTETENLIGFFANTLLIRADLCGNPTFCDLLMKVREVALNAFSNQDIPFEKLVEELHPDRDLSRNPLFQVMFVVENGAAPIISGGGVELELDQQTLLPTGPSKFDLTLHLQERKGCLQGRIVYREDLFNRSDIERMAVHFEVLLRNIVSRPAVPIGELDIIEGKEKQQILEEWNNTAAPRPQQPFIHKMFELQVGRTPQAIAIRHEDSAWTYTQLDQRANQIASYLRSLGIDAESLVGICVQRSPEMIAAILGTLKAGGAYLPMDPRYPTDRLKYMLVDSGAAVLITESRWNEKLPQDLPLRRVLLDRDQDAISACAAEAPQTLTYASMAAYVIYTSGSTGSPKGVVIEHRSAAEFLEWTGRIFENDELAGMLFSTSICFDLSIFEIFAPLTHGGTVIVAENALQLPPSGKSGQITFINTVPSAIIELLRLKALPVGIKTVALAGEALQRQTVDDLYHSSVAQRIINFYGPTEDTTYSTYAELQPGQDGEVPIGHPISNGRAYILDENLKPVPIHVAGEIYLAGSGLARGYLNKPDMTADRFIPEPYSGVHGARMYRTGDRGRWLANGNLQFVGRLDQQVKLRGYRIELGEIESVLREHEAIAQAAVLVDQANIQDKQLIGYVACHPGKEIPNLEKLKDYLRRRLPEYMVPDQFIVLDALPMTSNGKLNRKALQKGSGRQLRLENVYLPPRNALEELLASIWSELLHYSPIGIKDNFFAIGGHSLVAMQVSSRLRDVLRLDVSVRLLFSSPTVESLCVALQALESQPGRLERISRVFLTVQQMNMDEVCVELKKSTSTGSANS